MGSGDYVEGDSQEEEDSGNESDGSMFGESTDEENEMAAIFRGEQQQVDEQDSNNSDTENEGEDDDEN